MMMNEYGWKKKKRNQRIDIPYNQIKSQQYYRVSP